MGCLFSCCKKEEELYDSEKITRTYDTNKDISTTPYYILRTGKKSIVATYDNRLYLPHSYS